MCLSCNPGVAQPGQLLLRDLHPEDLVPGAAEQATPPSSRPRMYHNGSIITMRNGVFSPVEAIAIQDDTIIAVGSYKEVKQIAGTNAEDIDLANRCLLPGFIEPHVHVLFSALIKNFLLDFSPNTIKTRQQALNLVSSKTSKDSTAWISGYGYDPSRVLDYEDLDRQLLDSVSPVNPVYIINQSGHLAYVNSAAFTAAGNTDQNTDATLGYMKDASGHLTGVLIEQAVGKIGLFINQPPPASIPVWWKSTLNSWAQAGCTTICDEGIGTVNPLTDPLTYSTLTKHSQLPVRFHGAFAVKAATPYLATNPPLKLGQVEVNTIKFFADGSTQGFTTAVKKPYLIQLNTPLSWGQLNYKDEGDLYAAMAPYFAAGWQISVHSNGDRASEQVLRVYERLILDNPSQAVSQMHRIEHFTVTNREQVEKAAKLGLGISHTIGPVHFWGQTFLKHVIGSPRAERIDPLRDDVDLGVVYSFHSDSLVTDIDLLLYVRTAVTRLMQLDTGGEEVLGEEQKIDLQETLCGITVNPAKQMGIFCQVKETWMGGRQTWPPLNEIRKG